MESELSIAPPKTVPKFRKRFFEPYAWQQERLGYIPNRLILHFVIGIL
jgi:hypothetical protein